MRLGVSNDKVFVNFKNVLKSSFDVIKMNIDIKKFITKKCVFFALFVCSIILYICTITGCSNNTEYVEKSKMALGTVISVKISCDKADEAIEDTFNKVSDIENEMSVKIKDSLLSKVNENAYKGDVKISDELCYVIKKALYYADLSEGAFDPTIGKLIDAWGIGTDSEHVLTKDEKKKFIGLCSYKDVVLNEDKKTIRYKNKDVKLDLGAIVKGYVADEMKKILVDKYNVESAMLNLGGNVLTIGKKNDDNSWNVGIAHPKKDSELFATLSIEDRAVVTSGNYERYFEKDGIRYHHIIDPHTAMPSNNGIISATIVMESSIDADALSTLTYVLGTSKAKKLIESLDGVEALFVDNELNETMTDGIDKYSYKKIN